MHIIIFLILLFFGNSSANAQLELKITQLESNLCKISAHEFIDFNSMEKEVKVQFNPKIQPIIINACSFVSVDKVKRFVLISGGFVSSSNCKNGNCTAIMAKMKLNDAPQANSLEIKHKSAKSVPTFTPLNIIKPKIQKQKNVKFLVALDAGHGGKDPGAIGKSGTKEKEITLQYVKHIEKTLKNAGYDVFLTRKSDEYLKLHERIDIAMLQNADIFISIHADSAKNKKARGATIYTLSPSALNEATKKAEARINISGNFVDEEADEDLIFNILNIQHNSNVRQSFDFASILKVKMALNGVKFTAAPIRSADFAVLKAPIFPAILLELGYISNIEDERMLNSKIHLERISSSIKKSLDEIH